MRFYNSQHQYYAGIDLHARKMYICVIDSQGETVFHRDMTADPDHLKRALDPFRPDVIVGVECVFTWYWISDYCHNNEIQFTLGHALYMKAIHGGKTKNDKIDSFKIASMLRGGMFPMAYVYPEKMRAARDLLRRRQYFVHHQSELIGHIQNTNTQYNNPSFTKNLIHPSNRKRVAGRFENCYVQRSVQIDIDLLDFYHKIIRGIEYEIQRNAKHHDPLAYTLLRTVPGIGPILALVILYEIYDINRFEKVGNFISYSRLVKCSHQSAGKRVKGGHNKIGNSHLKWAFSEAAVLFLRGNKLGKDLYQRLSSRYGKAKALSLIAQKLGRTVYFMLKRKEPFIEAKFY
ncbi:MAG: IS110 family transposase [Desulfobacterales bacterium]|nr:IS110 family transposase [Desulfobacterales bacterium]